MKIKRVLTNNRKKSFVLETRNRVFDFPFSQLALKPSRTDPIASVKVDPELGREGFTYVLRSGREESVMMDDVLYYNEDAEYLCELMLHRLTAQALKTLAVKNVSKRELARKLKTSPKQLYRLLDPAFYGKSIDQMVKLLHALGHSVELRIGKKAA